MSLLALISLNLPQPWPDLSHTVVCLYFNSVPYRKVRNRKCKQSSRSLSFCRGSRVEGSMSRVEGTTSRVEGNNFFIIILFLKNGKQMKNK